MQDSNDSLPTLVEGGSYFSDQADFWIAGRGSYQGCEDVVAVVLNHNMDLFESDDLETSDKRYRRRLAEIVANRERAFTAMMRAGQPVDGIIMLPYPDGWHVVGSNVRLVHETHLTDLDRYRGAYLWMGREKVHLVKICGELKLIPAVDRAAVRQFLDRRL